jgi:hypothetical protein
MKLILHIFILSICTSLHASGGFFRERIIDPASPLSVLDPARRPEIERLAQNLRFFGNLGARPSSDVYVHYQAIQNLLVFPTSPLTALSWMLFPISPLPTMNPNNIGASDPLGKMKPEQLGQLIAVVAGYKNPATNITLQLQELYQIFTRPGQVDGFVASELMAIISDYAEPATYRTGQLQEFYQIFTKPGQVNGFVKKHSKEDLREFYRYSVIDGVSKYVHRNINPIDEDLNLTEAQQTACVAHPHLLVTAALKKSSSHLLEIPGTERLRERGETYFTQAALETGLQELPKAVKDRVVYKQFSDQGRGKFRAMATVDMLRESARRAPDQTLQLLAYYAWRKFGDKIDDVIVASGAIDAAQRPELLRILENPFTKADYQGIIAAMQASADPQVQVAVHLNAASEMPVQVSLAVAQPIGIDIFVYSLTEGERNLLLYGGARFAQIRFQDYGNVLVEHAGRHSAFANCAEMSLFNLTYLAHLQEQGIGLERNRAAFPEGSPLKAFWAPLEDDQLGTTATRNSWTTALCRLNDVVYRKGGTQRAPWSEASTTSHWAELNPGILNQMRALFHLLGKPDEAAALTYADSTEAIIEATAHRLSQLLSGEQVDHSIGITPKEGLKNIAAKKDWYGEFELSKGGETLAVWHIQTGHSFLKLVSKKTAVFPLDTPYTNPYIIGQLEVPEIFYGDGPEVRAASILARQLFAQKLESLRTNPQAFEAFFAHANLADEQFRGQLVSWCVPDHKVGFYPVAHKILWGMLQIDEGREASSIIQDCQYNGNAAFLASHTVQKLASFSFKPSILEQNNYGQACLNYTKRLPLSVCGSLQPENRCRMLFFDVLSTLPAFCVGQDYILASKAIEILSHTKFQQLEGLMCDFYKYCDNEDVAKIARLLQERRGQELPEQLSISINRTISSDHFWAFASNIEVDKMMYWMYGGQVNPEDPLLPTHQESAYGLLLPFAKAGRPFEPPFINFPTIEDLEPVYGRLRLEAEAHRMNIRQYDEADEKQNNL